MQIREAQATYRALLDANPQCKPITTFLLGDGGYGVTCIVDGEPITIVEAMWSDALARLVKRDGRNDGI